MSALRSGWIIAAITLMIMGAGIVLGFAWARKTVTLVDGGKETVVKTRAVTVEKLLEEQKVTLGPEDRVTPGLAVDLFDGNRVEIKRACLISLIVDGETLDFYSAGDTVGDVLKEKKITLNALDIVRPAISREITGDTGIKVIRVRNENEEITATIPFETRRVPKNEMSRGLTRTISAGENGEEVQTWRVTFNDGQEVNRVMIERNTITEAVERVLEVGTGQTVSRGGEMIRFREALEVVATAYTYTGRNTASGTSPEYGTVAVDPRVIPLGTRLYIEGYGYATALDRGGSIHGNRIDIFLESPGEAYGWGIRRVTAYLLE